MSDDTTTLTFKCSTDDAGKRLDAYLADKIDGWSRSRLQRLIESEDVLVNDAAAKPSYKVREGDEIEVDLVELPVVGFEPEDISLDIVFEDEYLAVINKPAGMVVHPGAGVQSGTLANAIAYKFATSASGSGSGLGSPPYEGGVAGLPGRGGSLPPGSDQAENRSGSRPPATDQGESPQTSNRPGIVHRLDKDTSGLIVVAKTDRVHEALSDQFRDREVYKRYVALVHGSPDQNTGTIDAPIGRNKHNRLRMKVANHGRSALTLWTVRKRFDKFTLLNVEIKTGRTHQIRVHMAYVNHPVVGDEIYNEGRDNTIADTNVRNAVHSLNRFFLHAEKLAFIHPITQDRMEFKQELPVELGTLLELL